jgi:HEAT repeat protein
MHAMKKIQFSLSYAGIVTLLVVSPLLAWSGVVETLTSGQGMSSRSEAYREAQRALDEKDWAAAEQLFRQVASEGGADADAALYWQAYSQYKRGRVETALKTLGDLRRTYPESSWIDDAQALEMEAKPDPDAVVADSSADDEELKLYALNSLLQIESERALPILETFLAGDHSLDLKEKALFVLSQSSAPRAREILVEIAKGERHGELSMAAIQYLGISSGEDTGDLLQQIYEGNPGHEVREQVLEAMMIGGYRDGVLQAARSESDAGLRGTAVELLGVMGATQELRELYAAERSAEVKESILEGMMIAGDSQTLLQLARTEEDPELRSTAIEGLGLIDPEKSAKALRELWETETDRDVKESILEAFFIQNNAEALIEIVREESDRELRKSALEYLSLTGSEEATDFLLEALED